LSDTLFKVTILGSGTIVPSLQRSACSVLIQCDSNRLLLDAGPGTMRRLLHTGTTIFDLTHVLASHFHPDHVAELVPLLFGTKYPDPTLQKHPLTLIGGHGLNTFYQDLQKVFGNWMNPARQWLRLMELPNTNNQNDFGSFELHAAPMTHKPESLAYRIQLSDGRSVVYSGDTDYNDALISLAHKTDLLICECSTPDDMKLPGHLTPSLAGSIAAKAEAKKLILTHLYPACEAVDLITQTRKTYEGPVVVAEDLMNVEVK